MRLSYDWKTLRRTFPTQQRKSAVEGAHVSNPIYCVVEDERVVAAYASCENLLEYVGCEADHLFKQNRHRKIVVLNRQEIDGWMADARGLPHSLAQNERLRELSLARVRHVLKNRSLRKQHFLFTAIASWWRKLLPNHYGLFLQVEGDRGQGILLSIKRGAIETFFEPDLNGMPQGEQERRQATVTYLSAKYLMPVQGVFVPRSLWLHWCESSDPWASIARSLLSRRARLVPSRFGITVLAWLRACFWI